ncbi:hypothetical protein GYA49_04050 [Candidatus Beckwithbacteria bacterium]|nr:hypothetical protein [Candidatus Beckwithbacteria bacterium]
MSPAIEAESDRRIVLTNEVGRLDPALCHWAIRQQLLKYLHWNGNPDQYPKCFCVHPGDFYEKFCGDVGRLMLCSDSMEELHILDDNNGFSMVGRRYEIEVPPYSGQLFLDVLLEMQGDVCIAIWGIRGQKLDSIKRGKAQNLAFSVSELMPTSLKHLLPQNQ